MKTNENLVCKTCSGLQQTRASRRQQKQLREGEGNAKQTRATHSKEKHKTKEEQITKRYIDLSGKITSKESNVLVDYFYEEHGNRKFLTRNIRGENIQYPSEWTVPSGNYFVMGDNRDNSNDSTKDVGFVPRENFFGEASYLFMTWECWTCLPYFSRVGTID